MSTPTKSEALFKMDTHFRVEIEVERVEVVVSDRDGYRGRFAINMGYTEAETRFAILFNVTLTTSELEELDGTPEGQAAALDDLIKERALEAIQKNVQIAVRVREAMG